MFGMTLGQLLLLILLIIFVLQILVIIGLTISYRRRKERRSDYPRTDLPILHTQGSEVNLYMEGITLFEDMLEAIESAEISVMFETFIWKDDEIGHRFLDAFVKKAQEGVPVYLIYDSIGNNSLGGSRLKFPKIDNLHVLPFLSFKRPRHLLRPSRYNVTHRKMLIIDNDIGFVGGYNLGDEYRALWRDTHVRFRGLGPDGLAFAFVDFWNTYRRRNQPELPYPAQQWQAAIQTYRNNPLRGDYPIRSLYLEALERASKRVIITNAYFVPDRHIRQAILRAADRGVQVDILIPWRSNHAIADWIARCNFATYLKNGVNIYGYNGVMIHAKTITVDGIWSMVGTANLDSLSLRINHEINVEIFDQAVATQMEEIFEQDTDCARKIELTRWNKRKLSWRLGEYLLSPLWPFI